MINKIIPIIKRVVYSNDHKPFLKKLGLLFLCISVFAFVLFDVNEGNAQQSVAPHLAVSPEKFELNVKRGQQLENDIRIMNKSDVAIPIEAKILNFTAEEYTGTIQFYSGAMAEEDIDDTSFNPAKWITLKNPNFILDPAENNKVDFSINIPENAEPGGHYAVILFEPKLPSFYFEEGQPRVLPIIGVIFLFSVEVEGLTRTATPLTIVEFYIPDNLHLKKLENLMVSTTNLFTEVQAAEREKLTIVEKSQLPFVLYVKNSDIYHFRPSGRLVILTNDNKIVGEAEIRETTILPGKTRQFPLEFKPKLPERLEKYLPAQISNFISQNLLFGKFKASLSLEFENGTIDSTGSLQVDKDFDFWVFPWKVVLSTGLALCLFMFLIVKYRKRVLKAIFVLFKK